MPDPIVVVGAGLSGLTCAKTLTAAGLDVLLVEASDRVGGRVRTDSVNGFLLDRGFQVLLTAYPEARQQLDYGRLSLRRFDPGSLVQTENGRWRLSDPWRQPGRLFETVVARVGGVADKIRIGKLRWSSRRGELERIFERPDRSSLEELKSRGFSDRMIQQFLRPFLGGVFLDHELETSSRMLHFVFRMFSEGDTALPAKGMGAIPEQLASDLPEDCLRLNREAASIERGCVHLADGEKISCRDVVVAVEEPMASRLLPELPTARRARSVYCVYFAAPRSPLTDRMLLLNGTGRGLVNNLCVPSDIAAGYAPGGQSLISTSVLTATDNANLLPQQIVAELQEWFGDQVNSWRHLQTYCIPYALPNQAAPAFDPIVQPARIRDNVFVCGDFRANGSINGAMQSGRLAAEAVLNAS